MLEVTASSKGTGTNTGEIKGRGIHTRIFQGCFVFFFSTCIFNPLMLAGEEASEGSVFIRCGAGLVKPDQNECALLGGH